MNHGNKYNLFDQLTYDQTWNPATGQDEWANAGGYGFWCNKACAERKDEERAQLSAQKQAELEAEQQLIEGLLKEGPPKAGMSTGATIGIVLGIGAVLGLVAYFIIKRRRGGQ